MPVRSELYSVSTIVEIVSGRETLPSDLCTRIYLIMVRARALEERMIKMSKSGQAHFWIGGPGEEAFNVCLGLQVKKGCGPAYDYLHLHYRNSATLLAMGMPLDDALRQITMTRTDPHSQGRNFAGHYAKPEWNVVPVSSVVEIQYVVAPGTAIVQKRHGGTGITIVVGGDAGTAEGDFASCMLWSTRPGNELPVLMIVMDNQWGISTATATQCHVDPISDRGKPFGIPGEAIDGNDPIASWNAIVRAMAWCRDERRPYLLEPRVSRLHGHSSSSGAVRVHDQPDCVEKFEHQLRGADVLTQTDIERIWADARQQVDDSVQRVLAEPQPSVQDVMTHTYAPSPVDVVYPDDYDGLPE